MTADYRRAWKHHRGDTETYQIFHLYAFSTGSFGEPFLASFKKKRNCSSCQPRSMFHQTLWQSSAQWHRAPGFGGPPLCSRARHMDCCWKCNGSTQLAEQQTPRHSKSTPTPVQQMGHRQCLSLQLNKFYSDSSLLESATAVPIYSGSLQLNKAVLPPLTKELRIPTLFA